MGGSRGARASTAHRWNTTMIYTNTRIICRRLGFDFSFFRDSLIFVSQADHLPKIIVAALVLLVFITCKIMSKTDHYQSKPKITFCYLQVSYIRTSNTRVNFRSTDLDPSEHLRSPAPVVLAMINCILHMAPWVSDFYLEIIFIRRALYSDNFSDFISIC